MFWQKILNYYLDWVFQIIILAQKSPKWRFSTHFCHVEHPNNVQNDEYWPIGLDKTELFFRVIIFNRRDGANVHDKGGDHALSLNKGFCALRHCCWVYGFHNDLKDSLLHYPRLHFNQTHEFSIGKRSQHHRLGKLKWLDVTLILLYFQEILAWCLLDMIGNVRKKIIIDCWARILARDWVGLFLYN